MADETVQQEHLDEGAQDASTVQEEQAAQETDKGAADETQKAEKLFTQAELDKIIVERLAREKAKSEKAQEEAKRLAKMNAEEKAHYDLEKKEKALADREAEINRRELTAEAKDMLSERSLPLNLHTLVNYASAETVQESIKALESALQKATEAAVGERLKGSAPKVSQGNGRLTKEDILKIDNPIERQHRIAENIELFN